MKEKSNKKIEEKNFLPFDEIRLKDEEMLVVYGGASHNDDNHPQESGSGSGCGCGCGCGC